MSERTREFFEGLKEVVQGIAPGLKDLVPEATAELGRLATQGQMELASALFNGNSFVPYGPGQYTPKAEHDAGVHGQEAQQAEHEGPQHEMEEERGGRSR